MKFEDALKRMVSPNMRRKGIMRGGIAQIMVGRACDRACYNCTQGSNLGGRQESMTVEHFASACRSLMGKDEQSRQVAQPYFGVVGVFGGNPCLHPRFDELCKVMRGIVPWEQRGLWTNNLCGKGAHARITFNPAHSNFNVHQDQAAWDEFYRDWPESRRYVKGLKEDSRHAPVFVGMRDLGIPEEQIWEMVSRCDINQLWSALVGEFRGELRGWFCEIAAAQAMLHQHEEEYPDTGFPLWDAGGHPWWLATMQDFGGQVRKHCPECGIPLRGRGELANAKDGPGGGKEQVSACHEAIYHPKRKGRTVEVVTTLEQIGMGKLQKSTDYIQNAGVK